MRSNDQFNTTIYGFSDRLVGLEGSRMIPLINPADMVRQGWKAGMSSALPPMPGMGSGGRSGDLTVTPFDLPDGYVGGHLLSGNESG